VAGIGYVMSGFMENQRQQIFDSLVQTPFGFYMHMLFG